MNHWLESIWVLFYFSLQISRILNSWRTRSYKSEESPHVYYVEIQPLNAVNFPHILLTQYLHGDGKYEHGHQAQYLINVHKDYTIWCLYTHFLNITVLDLLIQHRCEYRELEESEASIKHYQLTKPVESDITLHWHRFSIWHFSFVDYINYAVVWSLNFLSWVVLNVSCSRLLLRNFRHFHVVFLICFVLINFLRMYLWFNLFIFLQFCLLRHFLPNIRLPYWRVYLLLQYLQS